MGYFFGLTLALVWFGSSATSGQVAGLAVGLASIGPGVN